MMFGLRVAFLLLLLVTGSVTVKGSDLSDAPDGNAGFGFDLQDNLSPGPSHEAAVHRPKRWSGGFRLFDSLRGNGPKPTAVKATEKPTGGDVFGFNRAEALSQDPKPSKPAEGNDFGFNLEDALHPAVKPTEKPTGGDCQWNVVHKLSTVIENQNQQLRLLMQLTAQPCSA